VLADARVAGKPARHERRLALRDDVGDRFGGPAQRRILGTAGEKLHAAVGFNGHYHLYRRSFEDALR